MNRYDDRARLVFHFAREEGAKLGHAMIGPEHLLLGLMREGGNASRVLTDFGANLEGLRRQVEEMVGRGDGLPRNETAAITPRARRVMELAGSEARSLGSNVIATEHILLGIIREGDGGVQVTPTMIFAGLVGAVIWNLATWYLGLPSSSSHALFGGLIGAAVVGVTTVAVRTLGTRAMIACLLTGQLAMAAIIDQFGLLGVTQQPLTFAR